MPEETPAAAPELAADIKEAADKTAEAAGTATEKGEDFVAGALSAFETRIRSLEDRIGAHNAVTKTAEVAAKPVAPVEETAEAVAPQVVVKPRKPHWLNSLPRFL
jgi:hypothetical protein